MLSTTRGRKKLSWGDKFSASLLPLCVFVACWLSLSLSHDSAVVLVVHQRGCKSIPFELDWSFLWPEFAGLFPPMIYPGERLHSCRLAIHFEIHHSPHKAGLLQKKREGENQSQEIPRPPHFPALWSQRIHSNRRLLKALKYSVWAMVSHKPCKYPDN